MDEFLYGKGPIREAIRAGRRQFKKIFYLKEGKHDTFLAETMAWAQEHNIPTQTVSRDWFEGRLPGVQTQGWAAQVSPFPETPWKLFLKQVETLAKGTVLALDQVQDPQNVGAILRSAEACGVIGILIPQDRSCPMSPAVSKASAGALEHLEVVRVKNLVRALKELKNFGYWVVGTEVQEAESALGFSWPDKVLLTLGSEGSGMRRLTREACDFLVHLPLQGKIESLNVAATAVVCLFLSQRGK